MSMTIPKLKTPHPGLTFYVLKSIRLNHLIFTIVFIAHIQGSSHLLSQGGHFQAKGGGGGRDHCKQFQVTHFLHTKFVFSVYKMVDILTIA